jgi:hypothetical protein
VLKHIPSISTRRTFVSIQLGKRVPTTSFSHCSGGFESCDIIGRDFSKCKYSRETGGNLPSSAERRQRIMTVFLCRLVSLSEKSFFSFCVVSN